MILSTSLMLVDQRYSHLHALRATLSHLVYPLQWLADSPVSLIKWLNNSLALRGELLVENAHLSAENLKLHAMQQKMRALEIENIRLRGLLDTSIKVGERVLIAELMAVDLAPYRHKVLIDKGRNSGVYEGQPVLNADAVIGQVLEVASNTSTVLLITDASHAMPVRNQRSGVRTVAMGTGDIHALSLPHLPNNADFRVGDWLVTSGLTRHFPDGYPVAVVSRVETRPGAPFLNVEARPLAKLDRILEVLLVWSLDDAPAVERKTGQPADEAAITGG